MVPGGGERELSGRGADHPVLLHIPRWAVRSALGGMAGARLGRLAGPEVFPPQSRDLQSGPMAAMVEYLGKRRIPGRHDRIAGLSLPLGVGSGAAPPDEVGGPGHRPVTGRLYGRAPGRLLPRARAWVRRILAICRGNQRV